MKSLNYVCGKIMINPYILGIIVFGISVFFDFLLPATVVAFCVAPILYTLKAKEIMPVNAVVKILGTYTVLSLITSVVVFLQGASKQLYADSSQIITSIITWVLIILFLAVIAIYTIGFITLSVMTLSAKSKNWGFVKKAFDILFDKPVIVFVILFAAAWALKYFT